ncbi:MAG: hypothetical protein DSZ31_01080 [Gammaproteobacteria bacterium]|nr:MAG: hypothetical protein DSZ31_01080 [Gammaproteobacteria bacterium]
MRVPDNIEINRFAFEQFKEDCPNYNLEGYLDMDRLRNYCWEQLRSVDAVKISKNEIELLEFSSFEDLVNVKDDDIERYVNTVLFQEYREKLFETLFLLMLLKLVDLNCQSVKFKIAICPSKGTEDAYAYDNLKRILKKGLKEKLQSLLKRGDKVIVFLTPL